MLMSLQLKISYLSMFHIQIVVEKLAPTMKACFHYHFKCSDIKGSPQYFPMVQSCSKILRTLNGA